jgi:hypothetical protein
MDMDSTAPCHCRGSSRSLHDYVSEAIGVLREHGE